MAETFRFGIIGAGVIGQTHAQAIISLPAARLVAVADSVPEKAVQLAEAYALSAYSDIQQMLERESLDVVTICTPSGLHGEHACMAMRAGAHVIIEKPIEITLARIDEILKVQRETRRKLSVISQHRFDRSSRLVKTLIEEQALGRLVLGNATIPWWRSQAYYDSGKWRGTWALDGGGILMNQSIHTIDLLQWFMGPVKSLKAHTATLVHQMECEDVAVATLRFVSGALGTLAATTGAYPGLGVQISLYGDQGSVMIEDGQVRALHLAHTEPEVAGLIGSDLGNQFESNDEEGRTTNDPNDLAVNTHALQMADLLHAIRTGQEPLVNGYVARQQVEIILGIYEAARTGKEYIFP